MLGFFFSSALRTDGFAVIRSALTAAEVESLRQSLALAFSRYPVHSVNRWVHLAQVELPDLPRLMAKLARLAGPRSELRPSHCFMKCIEPEHYATAKLGWHRDADAAGTEALGEAAIVWTPLDDVGAGAPSLQFLRGSHRVLRRVAPSFSSTGRYEILDDGSAFAARHCPGAEVATPMLAAGDAVLFDQHVLHRTQPLSGIVQGRRSLECRLALRWPATLLRRLLYASTL